MNELHQHRQGCKYYFAPLDVCSCVEINMLDHIEALEAELRNCEEYLKDSETPRVLSDPRRIPRHQGEERMIYLKHKSDRATRLISLEGIRWVQCTRANPQAALSSGDTGKIVYEDGYVLDVPFECAEAVLGALKSKTVPAK